MREIDRAYISVALFLLIVGMLQGLYMGIAKDTHLRSVHIAILLPGFLTVATFGMLFRLWPAMKKPHLAAIQFWTAIVGTVGGIVGTYLFVTYGDTLLVFIASLLAIVSTFILAWLFWTSSGETA